MLQKLERIFPHLEVIVESKADLNHPIVSAASVCAKVTRDRLLRGWRYRERLSREPPHDKCGSGYPAEPATKAFLRQVMDPVFGFPRVVRMAWSTATLLMEQHCVALRWPDDDTEDISGGDKATTAGGGSRKRRSLAVEAAGPPASAAAQQMMKRFATQSQPSKGRQLRRQLENNEYFARHQLCRITKL